MIECRSSIFLIMALLFFNIIYVNYPSFLKCVKCTRRMHVIKHAFLLKIVKIYLKIYIYLRFKAYDSCLVCYKTLMQSKKSKSNNFSALFIVIVIRCKYKFFITFILIVLQACDPKCVHSTQAKFNFVI